MKSKKPYRFPVRRWSIALAARCLGISRRTVYKLMNLGYLTYVWRGRYCLIPPEDVFGFKVHYMQDSTLAQSGAGWANFVIDAVFDMTMDEDDLTEFEEGFWPRRIRNDDKQALTRFNRF